MAEFFKKAADHGVLMRINHHGGLIVARQSGQRLRFWRVEQQMVAVHVQPASGCALVVGSAVRIGARNDQHVDVV